MSSLKKKDDFRTLENHTYLLHVHMYLCIISDVP